MVFKDFLISIFSNLYFLGFLSMAIAYMLAIRIFPVIIFTVRNKNLMDEPENRSMHAVKTPTLGGVGLFVAFSLTLMLFGMSVGLDRVDLLKLLALLAAIMILLFLGVKDDLIALSPKKKFMGQIIAAAIVVFSSDTRLQSFYGLLGIGELPYALSVLVSVLVFVFIINAFNLIDGIDGLAGAIATIASATFGVFFLLNGQYLLALVSCILIGALLGFMHFNLSDRRKLFMGDSGSLFIGFLLAYQAMAFLVLNESGFSMFTVPNGPIIALAVLSFPILDTLRVIIVRMRKKQSPFKADRNHIHHRLLDLGLNHKQASVLISIGNILIIEMAFLLSDLYINVQLYFVFLLVPFMFLIPLLWNPIKGLSLDILRKTDDKGTVESTIEEPYRILNSTKTSSAVNGKKPITTDDKPTDEIQFKEKRGFEIKNAWSRRKSAKGFSEVKN